MSVYEKFRETGADCSCFGLEESDGDCGYFCTPRGFRPLFATGVDGICFGFIRGFGEMVFSLSPMNLPGDYVHPVARSFGDFLRLLLTCGADAAEQAHGWNKEEFEAFLQEQDEPEPERAAAMEAVARGLGIEPMERPFEYIKELQAEFDYSRIKFKKREYPADAGEAEEGGAPWEVRFPSESGRSTRPGREAPVSARFSWGGYDWLVPAVYVSARGLIVDLCRAVPAEQEREFLEKWAFREGGELSQAGRELAEAENPLVFDFDTELTVNGNVLRSRSGFGFCFAPSECGAEWSGGRDAKRWVEHYCLDEHLAWAMCRRCFPWAARRAPGRLERVTLRLRQSPVAVTGEEFEVTGAGDEAVLTHPVTGERHVLRVVEYEKQSIPEKFFGGEDAWEYPTHCTAMSFVLEPPLPRGELSLRDCGEGDRPRRRAQPAAGRFEFTPVATAAASMGIIGGADGPVAFCVSGNGWQAQTACSALSFEPRPFVRWRAVFYRRWLDDIEVELNISGGGI